ncbi:MAG: hypothetical protein D6834_03085 [Aquificota bacterium]|nr:MAG: hypothetical protein D6834_03085 [Aquificota bacterium]
MKNKILFLLLLFGISYADTLIINSEGKDTYVQEEKFMFAEGENVIGPVNLLPIISSDLLKIKIQNGYVKSYVINNFSKDWKKNLKGKKITVEGNGRFISGKVINIKDNYIMLDTPKGFVITTIPKFPGKISLKGSFKETFSPIVNLKIFSKDTEEKTVKIIYPVQGIKYSLKYISDKGKLISFLIIENKTPVHFKNINLKIKGKFFTKQFNKVFIPPFSKKVIKINLKKSEYEEGIIYRYKNESIEKTTIYKRK